MGLLKSVDDVPGINYYEYRDNLYYNNYEYRLRATIPCIKYTWYCKNPEELDKKIEGKFNRYGNVRKEDKQDVIDNLPALKFIVKLQKEKKKKQIGIRIESETIAVFSNDIAILKDIATELGTRYKCNYTQVKTSQYAGIKHFVNDPPHKYRVYLKSKRVEDNFHIEFRKMCERQPGLHPSPALKRWLYNDGKRYGIWYFRWASSAHFIDYDDESTLSYLALMYGEILGKKYKLEKRPDNI
jgi:hypothetical protein